MVNLAAKMPNSCIKIPNITFYLCTKLCTVLYVLVCTCILYVRTVRKAKKNPLSYKRAKQLPNKNKNQINNSKNAKLLSKKARKRQKKAKLR